MSDLTVEDVELTVVDELEQLLPAHGEFESEEFRRSVEQKGQFDEAIVYWGKDKTIIDGHKRFRLWQSLPEDTPIPPPRVREEVLPDLHAVREWILRRQLGRRNLGSKQYSVLRGRLYNETKGTSGRPEKKGDTNVTISDDAAESVAEETNTTSRTVLRDAAFVNALDAIGAVNGKAKADIESGALKVSKADVAKIGKLSSKGIAAAIKNLRNGRKWNQKEAASIGPQLGGTPSVVLDEVKRPVPAHLIACHDSAAPIKSAATKLDAIKKAVSELCDTPGGQFLPYQQIEIAIKELKGLISHARYYTECPRCKGKPKDSCDRCHGHGFIPYSRRGTLSSEDKAWLGITED